MSADLRATIDDEQPDEERLEILQIHNGPSNYYGGINIALGHDGLTWWSVTNWNGDNWDPCPRYLYDALVCFERERTK